MINLDKLETVPGVRIREMKAVHGQTMTITTAKLRKLLHGAELTKDQRNRVYTWLRYRRRIKR